MFVKYLKQLKQRIRSYFITSILYFPSFSLLTSKQGMTYKLFEGLMIFIIGHCAAYTVQMLSTQLYSSTFLSDMIDSPECPVLQFICSHTDCGLGLFSSL